jgi:hypothetical protein
MPHQRTLFQHALSKHIKSIIIYDHYSPSIDFDNELDALYLIVLSLSILVLKKVLTIFKGNRLLFGVNGASCGHERDNQ